MCKGDRQSLPSSPELRATRKSSCTAGPGWKREAFPCLPDPAQLGKMFPAPSQALPPWAQRNTTKIFPHWPELTQLPAHSSQGWAKPRAHTARWSSPKGPISSCTKDFLYQFASKDSPVLTWPGCSQRRQGCSRRQLERCFIWCCCFPSDYKKSVQFHPPWWTSAVGGPVCLALLSTQG